MVVNVLPNIIEVVVFPPRPNALLGVASPCKFAHFQVGIARTQEERLVLVHAGVREEEGWIVVGYARGRGPEFVPLFRDEVVDEG